MDCFVSGMNDQFEVLPPRERVAADTDWRVAPSARPSHRTARAALGLALGVIGLFLLGSCTSSDATDSTAVPAALADQLRGTVVNAAESDVDFRRDVSSHADRIGCVAEVFGVDPAGAATASDVRTIYSHVECAEVTATGDLDSAEAMEAPAAVTLTNPARVVVPADDQYSVDLHRIFPSRFLNRAAYGPRDPDALNTQLRERLKRLASQPAK